MDATKTVADIVNTHDFLDNLNHVLHFKLGDEVNRQLLNELYSKRFDICKDFDREYSCREKRINRKLITEFEKRLSTSSNFYPGYSDVNPSTKINSFHGVPVVMYDSHRHAHDAIINFLEQQTGEFLWLRLDTHYDMDYDEKRNHSTPYKEDYVLHVANNEQSRKIMGIERYSTTFGPFGNNLYYKYAPNTNYKKYIDMLSEIREGLTFKCDNYNFLPKIDAPTVIDVDLDFLEKSSNHPTFGGMFNCCLWDSMTVKDVTDWRVNDYFKDNVSQLRMNPTYAAHLLREKVQNPALILIATERSYRNRVFHHMIEHDFLNGLIC